MARQAKSRPPRPARPQADAAAAAEEYVSTLDAARICGVSTFSIQRWFDEGLLRGGRFPGGRRRILAASLKQFMARHGMAADGHAEARRFRLLLLDRDARQLGLLEDQLGAAGDVLVRRATTGLDASLALAEFKPEAFVCGADATRLPAAALVSRVRGSALGRALRIVVLARQPAPRLVAELKEAGADVVLARPVDVRGLRKALGLR